MLLPINGFKKMTFYEHSRISGMIDRSNEQITNLLDEAYIGVDKDIKPDIYLTAAPYYEDRWNTQVNKVYEDIKATENNIKHMKLISEYMRSIFVIFGILIVVFASPGLISGETNLIKFFLLMMVLGGICLTPIIMTHSNYKKLKKDFEENRATFVTNAIFNNNFEYKKGFAIGAEALYFVDISLNETATVKVLNLKDIAKTNIFPLDGINQDNKPSNVRELFIVMKNGDIYSIIEPMSSNGKKVEDIIF